MSVALQFPGQGAQSPGFLHRLPDHAAVRATLAEAAEVLGVDVLALDTAEALASTVAVQLSTVIAGVAVARALTHEGLHADAVAGLSVGAFAAAVICGSLAFADALPLVKLRGEGMEQAYPSGYGMVAIIGLDERQVERIVAQASGPLYIANVNSPHQIVLAGADAALDAAAAAARQAGARKAERLAVGVPSHCPLLEGVSRQLAAAMDKVRLNTPRVPYVCNRRGRAVYDAEGIRADLIGNVSNTVRWHDAITVLFELGVRLFVEPPPGQVLTRLAKPAFCIARSVAVEEAGLDGALLLSRREQNATNQ